MPTPARTGLPARPWSRSVLMVWLLAAAVILIDQLTKVWAVAALSDGSRVRLLGSWLSLVLLRNPGAAFSFATGQTWLFALIAVVVSGIVVWVSRRLASTWWALALGLVLGGAVGNLVDRLVRSPGFLRGRVIDFLDYGGHFVGNIADIAIVVAAGIVMVLSILGVNLDGSRVGKPAENTSSDQEPDPGADPAEGRDAAEAEDATEARDPAEARDAAPVGSSPDPAPGADPAPGREPAPGAPGAGA